MLCWEFSCVALFKWHTDLSEMTNSRDYFGSQVCNFSFNVTSPSRAVAEALKEHNHRKHTVTFFCVVDTDFLNSCLEAWGYKMRALTSCFDNTASGTCHCLCAATEYLSFFCVFFNLCRVKNMNAVCSVVLVFSDKQLVIVTWLSPRISLEVRLTWVI